MKFHLGRLAHFSHYIFIEVFLKEVRSHLGDPAHLTGLTSIWTASKTSKQSKEYVWLLLSSWIVICLRWRSKKGKIRNLIVTMFFSVSYGYISVVLTVTVQKQPLEVSFKKIVLTNFANFIGKLLCWNLILKCIPVKFTTFF